MSPSPDDFPFRIEVPARFADLDVNMHLNNTSVSSYYEDARTKFHLSRFRTWMSKPEPQRSRFFVGRTAIEYFAEGTFPATYTVAVGISKVGTSSFTDSLGLFTEEGRLIGACDTVMVHSHGSGSAPLPADLRDVLAELTVASLLRH